MFSCAPEELQAAAAAAAVAAAIKYRRWEMTIRTVCTANHNARIWHHAPIISPKRVCPNPSRRRRKLVNSKEPKLEASIIFTVSGRIITPEADILKPNAPSGIMVRHKKKIKHRHRHRQRTLRRIHTETTEKIDVRAEQARLAELRKTLEKAQQLTEERASEKKAKEDAAEQARLAKQQLQEMKRQEYEQFQEQRKHAEEVELQLQEQRKHAEEAELQRKADELTKAEQVESRKKERIDCEFLLEQGRVVAAVKIQSAARLRSAKLQTQKIVKAEQDRKRRREVALQVRRVSMERLARVTAAVVLIQTRHRIRVGKIRVGKLREERDMERQLQEARRRDKDREKKKRQESFAKRKKQQARFQERFGALDSKTATLPAHFRRAQNSTTTKIHL